jgi:hypothetical protein
MDPLFKNYQDPLAGGILENGIGGPNQMNVIIEKPMNEESKNMVSVSPMKLGSKSGDSNNQQMLKYSSRLLENMCQEEIVEQQQLKEELKGVEEAVPHGASS